MFNFYPPMGGATFEATYRAFPLAFIDKQSAEYGDKVIMPPSALHRLGAREWGRPPARRGACTRAVRRAERGSAGFPAAAARPATGAGLGALAAPGRQRGGRTGLAAPALAVARRQPPSFASLPSVTAPPPSPPASLHIEYPMLFKVENGSTGRSTHCGVLEFIAQEGHVYLPRWVGGARRGALDCGRCFAGRLCARSGRFVG
jgi:hypothetical protein